MGIIALLVVYLAQDRLLIQGIPYDQPEKIMELEAPKRPWCGIKHFIGTNILHATVTAVTAEKGKYGIDYTLVLKPVEILEEVQMTVWGSNYNFMYNTHGHKSEDWVGKKIIITQITDDKGKIKRVIS